MIDDAAQPAPGEPPPSAPTPAPADRGAAVLHLTAAAGGGIDRYIRDLATGTGRAHLIWHAGSKVDVIEHPRGHFQALESVRSEAAAAALAAWLRAAGTGIVHLHGVSEECRSRLALLEQTLGLPWVVTLHDVSFVNPRAFETPGMPAQDAAWIDGIAGTLRRAAAVIAPSEFIRELAVACVPGLAVEVISPGLRPAPAQAPHAVPAEFSGRAPARVVAVVGAIGPHKGARVLDALAEALAGSDIGIVVIGYTDTQIAPGWIVPGRYYVHGPYVDDTLAGWLAAYGAAVVLFPNRLPESFSYTLSEVWSAGLPVIVPDDGALGARVAQQGGGWRLPAGYGAAEAARLLRRLLAPEGAAEVASVRSQLSSVDAARVPPLDAMVRNLDAMYGRFALPPPDPASPGAPRAESLAPLLAANLDGFTFRQELVRLVEELANLKAALPKAMAWAAKLEADVAATQAAAAKVEQDLADAQAWTKKLENDLSESEASATRLERELEASQAWSAKLTRDVEQTEASARLLQHHLDDSTAALNAEVARLDDLIVESQARSDKLESAITSAFDDSAALEREIVALEVRADDLQKELTASQAWVAKLEGDVAVLNTELAQRVEETRRLADDKAAFDLLPELLRKFLLKRVFRARR